MRLSFHEEFKSFFRLLPSLFLLERAFLPNLIELGSISGLLNVVLDKASSLTPGWLEATDVIPKEDDILMVAVLIPER